MKILKLKDGTEINFTDASTIHSLVFTGTLDAIDGIRDDLTKENLSQCNFNATDYADIIPVGVSITADMTGDYTATFTTRDMTDVEKLQETQAEQDDVINYLLMQ